MKIGLLLGSFDPPHIGHVANAMYALNHGMDKVYVVPCWKNPTKENQTDFEHRFNMCYATFNDCSRILVFDDDKQIQSQNTYEYLNKAAYIKNSDNEYFIIIGSDIDISTWYKGSWILNNFPVVKVPRMGYKDTEEFGIKCSSSAVRNALKYRQLMSPYLTYSVIKYIKHQKLYGY